MIDNFLLSSQQQQVFDAMMQDESIALFGAAGSGKSIIVKKFLQAKSRAGDTVCLTPTGLAARNIGEAQTIHSFFSIDSGWIDEPPFNSSRRLQTILPHIRTIIIDEISMVRCEIFELIDKYSRMYPITSGHHPFGGRQIIVVGDFKQLPPVVSDDNIKTFLESEYGGYYAFKTQSWLDAKFKYYYLNQVHRQTDSFYIGILNCIRNNISLPEALAVCNNRVAPFSSYVDFQHSPAMALCSRRKIVSAINNNVLAILPGRTYKYEAFLRGKFPRNEFPTEYFLELKVGAKVMLLANKRTDCLISAGEYEYVNGDTGIITGFDEDRHLIIVRLHSGRTVFVQRNCWINYEYDLVEENGEQRIKAVSVGEFIQFPIATAYACTIHKAQGLTLDNIYLMLGQGCFASGQLYTALSRVRSLNNLTLETEIQITDAICDPMVDDFYMKIQYEKIL